MRPAKWAGIYYRLRASRLYDCYLNLTNRQLLRERDREADFYRSILEGFQPGDRIFDIGANQGDKTDTFLRIGARVVAVDPDEDSGTILRQRFLRYRLRPLRVTIEQKAAGSKSGTGMMLVCAPGSVFNTLSSKGAATFADEVGRHAGQSRDTLQYDQMKRVETTTLDELVETYGLPVLIKIDVLGFELEVLQGLHRPVPCLSFEIGLPQFRQELFECVELLGRLSSQGRFNYTWDRRNGLVLENWVEVGEFLNVLAGCREGPLEVFYRTPR